MESRSETGQLQGGANRPRTGGSSLAHPSKPRARISVSVVAILAVTGAALALRLWHLRFQSLWWDEGVSIYLSGVGVGGLTIAKDFSVDLHPPGYHLALATWRLFLGPSVFSVRLFSVFAGTITVPLTYSFVRRVATFSRTTFSDRSRLLTPAAPPDAARSSSPSEMERRPGGEAALLAAVLVAISPIDVYYSQETRMYALLPVVGLLSLIVTTRLLGAGKRGDWILWILVNGAALYTYYYLGLLVAAEALVLLGPAWKRGQPRPWLVAQVATLALYLPWAALMARRLGGGALALPPETAVHLTPLAYLQENWQDFTLGFTSPPEANALLIVFGVGVVVGVIAVGQRNPVLLALVIASLLVPLAGAGAVLLFRPFFYPRFIIFAVIPLLTLAAIGLTAYRRLWPVSVLLAALIIAGNGWTWYHERITPREGYAPDDYRVVFSTLEGAAQPGDVVLCGYPWQAGYVQAYLWRSDLGARFLPGHPSREQIDRIVAPNGRAWVYDYSPDRRFEGNWLEQTLGDHESTLVVDQYGDSRVRLFAASPASASPNAEVKAKLGDAIAFVGSTVDAPAVLHPGDTVRIALRWQALSPPRGSYTVFVHLLGPDGKLYGQHDGPPVGGAFPTNQWTTTEQVVDRYALTVAGPAPAGRYEIEIGMYEPSNGQRLVVGPSPQKDNRIVIGALTVGN